MEIETLTADGLHLVGYCSCCKFNQTTLYFIDKEGYCLSCFPKIVDLKIAIKKLKELEK
jgi:hypothetical protein